MKNLREIILDLREIYENDKETYSYNNLLKMMEENGGYYPSKATLSRLFGDNWEKHSYDYEHTIRPIAKVMIGIDYHEETDDIDTKALKDMLKYKIQRIEELEAQIDELKEAINHEKAKYHEKLASETVKFQRSLDFATNQINLKDKRIDQLMDANDRLSITNNRLLNQFLDCPLKNKECSDED